MEVEEEWTDGFFDDGNSCQQAENNSWKKLKLARLKDGFSDGKFLGEEKALQEGFNEGYRTGFEFSFEVAVLRGITGALETNFRGSNLQYLSQASELKKKITELEHRCIEIKKFSMPNYDDSKKFECHSFEPSSIDSLLTSEAEAMTSVPEITHKINSLDHSNRSSCDEDMRKITEELNLIKQKLVVFMEESGYSKISKHIINGLF